MDTQISVAWFASALWEAIYIKGYLLRTHDWNPIKSRTNVILELRDSATQYSQLCWAEAKVIDLVMLCLHKLTARHGLIARAIKNATLISQLSCCVWQYRSFCCSITRLQSCCFLPQVRLLNSSSAPAMKNCFNFYLIFGIWPDGKHWE